jgi:hypothetical protein
VLPVTLSALNAEGHGDLEGEGVVLGLGVGEGVGRSGSAWHEERDDQEQQTIDEAGEHTTFVSAPEHPTAEVVLDPF